MGHSQLILYKLIVPAVGWQKIQIEESHPQDSGNLAGYQSSSTIVDHHEQQDLLPRLSMPRVAPKTVEAVSLEALVVQVSTKAMMQSPAATLQSRIGPGCTQKLGILHFHGRHGISSTLCHPPLETQSHVDLILRFYRLILARGTQQLGWQGTRHQLEPVRN